MQVSLTAKCPECNHENSENTLFCSDCVAELPSSEHAPASAAKTLESSCKEFARSTTFAGLYEIIEELGMKAVLGKKYEAIELLD